MPHLYFIRLPKKLFMHDIFLCKYFFDIFIINEICFKLLTSKYNNILYSSLCTSKQCDYLFYLESEAHLDNPQTLKTLIQHNK